MLGLKLPTDPRWANLAEKSLAEILTDHAFCEQKAATSCISLIQQYPEKNKLVRELMPIVSEEWQHFRQVIKELDRRELQLGQQRKDEYVNALMNFMRKGISKEEKLLDRLLVCALIEARSCERFRVLSINISDDYFKKFYHDFMVAEAGHYRLFIDLAKTYFDEAIVKDRWEEWLDHEADVMSKLEIRGDRVH